MKNILLLCFFFISYISFSQVYISDYSNQIFKIDLSTCTIEGQFEIGVFDTLTDLAIRTDGQLYGITNSGKLFQVNPETGNVLLVHSFLNLQSFEALYCSESGIIYVSGSEGFFYSYEIGTKTEEFIGDLGDIWIKDLLLYTGELYGTTENNKLLHIDFENPSHSTIVMDLTGETIQGLFMTSNAVDPCELQTMFGISSSGKIYQIDTKAKTNSTLCDLGINASGATSMQDLFQYSPLQISDYSTKASQCKEDNGSVEIVAQGGVGGIRYGMNHQDYQVENILTNLPAGNYSIQVKDDNGCVITLENIKIEHTEDPVIKEVTENKPICAEGQGSLTIKASGVTTLTYSIDGINFQPEENFSQIHTGDYEVFVLDTNGCQTSRSLEFDPEGNFEIKEIKKVAATCNTENGQVEIVLNEEYTDLSYSLDTREQPNPLFDEVGSGTHMISIRQGAMCQIDTSIILNSDACPVFVPNAFSPDEDGINDDFRIYTGPENDLMITHYSIFDRWGGKIYNSENFSVHDEGHWWDGKLNATKITQGLYIYVIEIRHQDGQLEVVKGQVTVM